MHFPLSNWKGDVHGNKEGCEEKLQKGFKEVCRKEVCQEINPQIRFLCRETCEDGDASDEAREIEERPQRQESKEPQTSDCYRTFRGSKKGRESSEEEILIAMVR
jgi:hypothetical protein